MKQGTNILLSLQQLTIGGAETHVVELAKELKRRGYNVVVTSRGGVYEKELEVAGIKHYRAPLDSKNPVKMMKAAHILKRVIRGEKIDIVHSHARISSFILGKLHKRMKFPFVTTAHWVFTTKYGLKYITDWGEKCVAVSEDIKKYLMDNYKVPARDIRVTINGIDTERFSPDTDCSDVCREFDLHPEKENIISYVSRMDESRSLVAKQLIDIFPRIDEKIENLKLIIVGSGDDFDNVKAKADAVNKKLGRDAIILTGARTDINKLIAVCKLFVGVSRAALEAMAAQKPVIISGNEGHIGLFEESKLPVGIDTNFCCRGCEAPDGDKLFYDIIRFFAMNGEERNRLGEYGRELIKREYSVSRMADDCVRVYDWVLEKHDEILISGYYGFRNSGDDALLDAIINDISRYKESPNIVVLSKNPKETEKTFCVRAINRYDLPAIKKHMRRAGMLISGGGTLVQDGTSKKSLIYYLYIMNMAIKNNVKLMLYSNGIGPLYRNGDMHRAAEILNKADIITLRDYDSVEMLEEMGVTKPPITVTADSVLSIKGKPKEEGRKLLNSLGIPEGRRLLAVSVRRWSDNCSDFEKSIAQACDYAADKYGFVPVLVSMQRKHDYPISESISGMMKNKAYIFSAEYPVQDVISAFANFDLCIGMRLHSLIYSIISSVPIIGLVYDPKVSGFLDYANQKLTADVNDLSGEQLCSLIDECMSDYDGRVSAIQENYKVLYEKALQNASLAIELYER